MPPRREDHIATVRTLLKHPDPQRIYQVISACPQACLYLASEILVGQWKPAFLWVPVLPLPAKSYPVKLTGEQVANMVLDQRERRLAFLRLLAKVLGTARDSVESGRGKENYKAALRFHMENRTKSSQAKRLPLSNISNKMVEHATSACCSKTVIQLKRTDLVKLINSKALVHLLETFLVPYRHMASLKLPGGLQEERLLLQDLIGHGLIETVLELRDR